MTQTIFFNASSYALTALNAISTALGIESRCPASTMILAEHITVGRRTGLLPWILANRESIGDESATLLLENFKKLASFVIEIQANGWSEVYQHLREAGVESSLLKGLLYAGRFNCQNRVIFNDVDMMIGRSDIEQSKKILTSTGFSQNVISHDGRIQLIPNESILKFESTHYELFPFTKIVRASQLDLYQDTIRDFGFDHPFIIEDGNVYVAIELDIHHNLSNSMDPQEIIDSSKTGEVFGLSARYLDWETHIWFVSARVYHEVMILDSHKLRPLVEVGQIVSTQPIDWNKVLEVSKKYNLSAGLYYVFSFLCDSFSVNIPADTISSLNECRQNQGRLHDFGDFVAKAFDESVLIRPNCLTWNQGKN